MLAVNQIFTAANEACEKAYEQTKKDIKSVVESVDSTSLYSAYIVDQGTYLLDLMDHSLEIRQESYYEENDFDTLLGKNHDLYKDVLPRGYAKSFVNPSYSVSQFGKPVGQILSSVAYILREYVGLCYEQRFSDMYRLNKLFLAVARVIEDRTVIGSEMEAMVDEDFTKYLSTLVRDCLMDGLDTLTLNNWYRQLSSGFNTYHTIVDHYDLDDLRYLFRYGMHIGTNEVESAKYIATLSKDQLQLIADTYTQAYVRGFERNGIDLTPKGSTLVTYHLGWERIIKIAYENFRELGLEPIVQYNLREEPRPRLYNTKPNKQMAYDHRFSQMVYFDDVYEEALESANVKALGEVKDQADLFAGLALIEVFGEEVFSPINSDDNMVYDEIATKLVSKFTNFRMAEYRKYVRGDNYSFTINTYPLPSIGEDYEAIFSEVIEVNTLDEYIYMPIQQKMIDALDQADYVHILGSGDNKTDLKVSLHPLSDPEKETKFNNCTADVNVPVGEIFTSPRLSGTTGLLHVKDVYLKGLQYLELKIWFEDGMIVKYDCANFDTDEANRNYVRESLLHPHTSLPLGEFAIGTNTVAYMMAKKYKINSILPILIGEKTGPHFAIGDTCYAWGEDKAVYNSDGKEIVAKDNAVSMRRKTDVSKAYMNKHTDITIPYDELGSIIGYDRDGGIYKIIEQGRFVLDGTQLLNEAFEG